MSTHEKETFLQTYDWAKTWEDLPWAHGEPTLFLANICQQRKPGRALDIGCGTGTDSVFLAQQGWDVTALDFVPKALELTQQRVEAAGVSVSLVEADITEWSPEGRYDLVLDHGLLHNMDPVRFQAYRSTVLNSLADDGAFVLLHWHPLFAGQANGEVGAKRVSRDQIKSFFAPELQERFFAREEFEDLPKVVGGGMSQAYYWFNRNQAHENPGELIEQIKATLTRHDCDVEALVSDESIEFDVAPELLARVLGPGRLGVCHEVPEPKKVNGAIVNFARRAGQSERFVDRLLKVFATEKHGNVCTANPKCAECDVKFCKRLRYR